MNLTRTLRAAIRGEVDDTARRRAEFTSDASNYRVVPQVVVFPRDLDDVLAAGEIARDAGVPLTVRGAGTSIAGNAVGTGVVMDMSRHLNRIIDIDPAGRTARVEPGVVLADLQAVARPHGLRFGPDPSTHARATLGGMIGNNACGPHAVAYGRTADNVSQLDVVDGLGRRFLAGQDLAPVTGLPELVTANLQTFRTELGRFSRQVSGYSLEHLLPERKSDLAKALVGTEGTVCTVLGATLNLVQMPAAAALVVLGYPDMAGAADDVPALLTHAPLAVEGLDRRLVDVVRSHRGDARVPELPAGDGWLMVEVGGSSPQEALDRARVLAADAATSAVRIVRSKEQAALWRIREDGAGLAGRTPAGQQAWPGWEDSAVPPNKLGNYLREVEALLAAHGLHSMLYGHFGDGCVHARIDFPIDHEGGALHDFVQDAARLVVSYGGSLSGEHGDGRARSQLLSLMYSTSALSAFAAFKNLLDPRNLLNPGILVDPAPVVADLRRPQALSLLATGSGFTFADDHGDFTEAVHRCVGVGKCRVETDTDRTFMCPSFQVTRDEKDSTRGRARVLQEMANGSLIGRGWKSVEVQESLDLCLSCKACGRDCPAGVDMAQYKSEVLHRIFRRRLRPISHYTLGWLPRWAGWAAMAPGAVNAVLGRPALARLVLRLGGMDPRRTIPLFAPRAPTAPAGHVPPGRSARPPVLLWVDTFTRAFNPTIAGAAERVLTAAGFDVIRPDSSVCCGLTLITTGQLDAARRSLRRLMDVLGPIAERGIPILGLEPSCTAVLRSDLPDMFDGDSRAAAISRMTTTVAEILRADRGGPASNWQPPDLTGRKVITQPHCHQYAVMGFEADEELLRRAGVDLTVLTGCCGLAGNFGMEKGHYEMSVAVAELSLLPALRGADTETELLADGFSCRTQAEQLAGRSAKHLVELLAAHLPEA